MAVIYSYPIKSTPDNDDLILISDGTDNLTKQVRVSTLPGGSSAGVSSFNTLTGAVTITGGTNVTLNPVGNNIEINAAGGSSGISVQGAGGTPITGITTLNFRHNFAVGAVGTTATMDVLPYGNDTEIQFKNGTAFGASSDLTFATNTLAVTHTVDIKGDGTNAGKLKLYCENTTTPHAVTLEGPAHSGAAAYTLKLPSPAPSNQQILQSDGSGVLSWINTPSSGGGGSVDSVNTTDGTFINLTPNSATTGAVTVTADLSATGTAGNTTFLRGDNQWITPTNTTDITLTTTGTSGASTWNGTTLNIPQYSGGGSGASLGFTPLSTYEADDLTVASYTYYALLVCDVDVTLSNAKVFVRSGTSAIYAALYSTTSGNMQTSSFTRLGTFSKTTGVAAGINILPVDGTFTLTAGQTIMLGFSSANQMAGGAAINSNAMGVETTSLTTSFPASIASIENTTSASKRVAIHFYAS